MYVTYLVYINFIWLNMVVTHNISSENDEVPFDKIISDTKFSIYKSIILPTNVYFNLIIWLNFLKMFSILLLDVFRYFAKGILSSIYIVQTLTLLLAPTLSFLFYLE